MVGHAPEFGGHDAETGGHAPPKYALGTARPWRPSEGLDAGVAPDRSLGKNAAGLPLALPHRHCIETLCESAWLGALALGYIDPILHRVDEPRERLRLCRLAAAVIGSDSVVSVDERRVYGRVLAP